MSRHSNLLLCSCFTSVVLLSCARKAEAQEVRINGEKPEFSMVLSPDFQGVDPKRSIRKEWIQFEAKLQAQMAPSPRSKTLDKLTVKWYIAVQNPDRPNSYLLLTKDVEHVNISLEEDTYVSIFISPSSIRRLTGADRASRSTVDLIGYEILVNEEKKAVSTNKGKPGWWNLNDPKLSRSDTIPLLSKEETPFAACWWDRYAEVAVPKR